MGDGDAMRAQLLHRITTRRAEIVQYVRRVRPWSNRLGTVSAVSSGLVAVTTAGPALGGDGLLAKLAGGGETLALWQGACLIALVVSLVSTLSAALLRRQDVAGRVATAESASAELGNLATALEFGRVDLDEAVTRYQQATATVPFVDENPGAAPSAPPAPVPTAPATSLLATPPPVPGPRPGGQGPGTYGGPQRPVPAWGPPPGHGPRRG